MKGSFNERVCAIYDCLPRGQTVYRPIAEIRGHVRAEIWRAVVVPAETYYAIWGRMNA